MHGWKFLLTGKKLLMTRRYYLTRYVFPIGVVIGMLGSI